MISQTPGDVNRFGVFLCMNFALTVIERSRNTPSKNIVGIISFNRIRKKLRSQF